MPGCRERRWPPGWWRCWSWPTQTTRGQPQGRLCAWFPKHAGAETARVRGRLWWRQGSGLDHQTAGTTPATWPPRPPRNPTCTRPRATATSASNTPARSASPCKHQLRWGRTPPVEGCSTHRQCCTSRRRPSVWYAGVPRRSSSPRWRGKSSREHPHIRRRRTGPRCHRGRENLDGEDQSSSTSRCDG